MQPKYPSRTDFDYRSDGQAPLKPGFANFDIHVITESGGNRKASKSEIEGIASGGVSGKLALYPQSAGLDAIDVDRGGLDAVRAITAQLSSYTPHSPLVVPSKTKGRFHVYWPVTVSQGVNTSPKWSLGASGGEIKGGTSRITLYHPISVINYALEMAAKDDRIDPEVIRRELCPKPKARNESDTGSYKKFLKRDLSTHDNLLSAFLAVFEAHKRGEIEDAELERITDEITSKSTRSKQEIARARDNAAKFVADQTGPETDAITQEKRNVRAAEIDIAVFVASKFKDIMRYIEETGKYLVWANDSKKLLRERGHNWQQKDILSDISKIVAQRYGTDEKERLYYGSAQRAKNVDSLLQGMVTSSINDFNAEEYKIGFPGLDCTLWNQTLEDSRPENKISQRCKYKPDFSKETPLWDKFILETFGEETAAYMQRYLGYCLTGSVREAKVLFLCGDGGTGKTTFANVVRKILGDYATPIAKKVLFPGKHSSDMHLTFIAQLQGKRLAIVPETDTYDKLNESLFKSLSGGDEITANYMRKDPFSFTNTAKLFVLSNPKPRLTSFDNSIRRRLVIIPCDNKPAQIDVNLEHKLMNEAGAILAGWIKQAREYCSNGLLALPEYVEETTQTHIDSQDVFACFIKDKCMIDPSARITSDELMATYKEYLVDNNETYLLQHNTARDIASRMRMYESVGVKGPLSMKSQGKVVRGYKGLGLKAPGAF